MTDHNRETFPRLLESLPVVKKDEEGNVHDAFTDPELRHRQRYVDLLVNDHVKETFIKRTKIFNSLRELYNSKGYLEVETPILQPIPGGAAAKPFTTHHNALDVELYLRIADELYLKRLIVGGFEGVYEFSKDFRNEGMDRTHNPEFTVMEIYVAYKDYKWMMDFTEEMLEKVALDVWAMMRKTNLMVDIDMMLGVNERTNLEDMQTYHVPNYDMTKIQEFVSTWPLEGKDGIGIAFIAEALDKREAKAYFHFVAVNLRTKQLLLHQRVVTSPAGMGLRNYWAGSIYKAIKLIEKKYYRRWRKELS